MIEVFRGFPQTFQTNAGIVFQISRLPLASKSV
jgi:hypothetical protein